MKNLSAILSLLGVLTLSMWACGSKKIPRFDRPIYSLDNLIQDNIRLRFKFDQDIIQATDPRARGAVVFLYDDFIDFTEVYISKCEKWSEDSELVTANELLRGASSSDQQQQHKQSGTER